MSSASCRMHDIGRLMHSMPKSRTHEIEIVELEKAVTGYEQSQKSAEKFIALIDKYENFDTLTNTMLNEFVEKILVHERAEKAVRTPRRKLKSTSIF